VKKPLPIEVSRGITLSDTSKVYAVYYISIPIIPRINYDYMEVSITPLHYMVSTMKIGEETKKSLLKIGAEHTVKDGKERSLEDIVKLLIEEHKIKQK
jgi:hypothetical protein